MIISVLMYQCLARFGSFCYCLFVRFCLTDVDDHAEIDVTTRQTDNGKIRQKVRPPEGKQEQNLLFTILGRTPIDTIGFQRTKTNRIDGRFYREGVRFSHESLIRFLPLL